MFLVLATFFTAGFVYFIVLPWVQESRLKKKLMKWHQTPKDVVILHAVNRGKSVTHGSPFVVKVETYLRMAKIPYKTDFGLTDAWGPKGRFPWISLNGEHMGDSRLIIEFLKKKFNVQLGQKYTPKESALGAIICIMMDEHFFWSIPLTRFVWGSFESIKKMMGGKSASPYSPNAWKVWFFKLYAGLAFNSRSKGHGIGLHSRQEIEHLTMEDLRYLSDTLGENKFILGNEPSQYDATVFGHLAVAMWGLPDSIYEDVLKGGKYTNLTAYCERMKNTFYPDWEALLGT